MTALLFGADGFQAEIVPSSPAKMNVAGPIAGSCDRPDSDDDEVACAVEDHARRNALRAVRARNGDRRWHLCAVSVVHGGGAGSVVGHPEQARRPEGDAPRIHEVRIDRRRDTLVGDERTQSELVERRDDGDDVAVVVVARREGNSERCHGEGSANLDRAWKHVLRLLDAASVSCGAHCGTTRRLRRPTRDAFRCRRRVRNLRTGRSIAFSAVGDDTARNVRAPESSTR